MTLRGGTAGIYEWNAGAAVRDGTVIITVRRR